MTPKEFTKTQIVNVTYDPNGQYILEKHVYELMQKYADLYGVTQQRDLLFCGGCGMERDFIVETDINSGRACKNSMCKEK